ncbi:MAG TPA: GNAT family N-acetyltransferase [Candidatus Acidoferrales bacterium]|nr:GNAT family N-acetyltransferase [Candidatus Acidoferrales bacterium]
MSPPIETKRLLLRPFEPADAEAAFRWLSDPLVMRFSPAGADGSLEQTRARLAEYRRHQLAHGFSKWMILERGSGQPIGDSGLLFLQDYDRIDLGFRLAPAHWGKGLATEAADAWVRAAFERFQIDRLTAFVHPENAASIRVLAKLGFAVVGPETILGMDSILFSLDATAALNQMTVDPPSL